FEARQTQAGPSAKIEDLRIPADDPVLQLGWRARYDALRERVPAGGKKKARPVLVMATGQGFLLLGDDATRAAEKVAKATLFDWDGTPALAQQASSWQLG